jgi:hypothetical protein
MFVVTASCPLGLAIAVGGADPTTDIGNVRRIEEVVLPRGLRRIIATVAGAPERQCE